MASDQAHDHLAAGQSGVADTVDSGQQAVEDSFACNNFAQQKIEIKQHWHKFIYQGPGHPLVHIAAFAVVADMIDVSESSAEFATTMEVLLGQPGQWEMVIEAKVKQINLAIARAIVVAIVNGELAIEDDSSTPLSGDNH